VDGQDPRQLLAQRLRSLREDSWSSRKITQSQLAEALGVSVPLISSWESQANPRIPPLPRLEAYASLFAAQRSFDGGTAHLIRPREMSDEERQTMNELKRELTHLRSAALRATTSPQELDSGRMLAEAPWRFEDGDVITVICGQIGQQMMEKIPYANIDNPDYIELLTYSELDSLFELHGHLRATNSATQVNLRIAQKLVPDDLTTHLAALGGTDWNSLTKLMLEKLELPVRQVADWETEGGQYFEVEDNATTIQHRPVLDEQSTLREDVALFARAVNPYNRERTVTICCGMYGRGTYGAVRALTDARIRERNAEYVRSQFGDGDTYCVLTRVPVVNGVTVTPDWTTDEHRLFEWAG
jgi:transcriptional regulator with XRE-family HTH domain